VYVFLLLIYESADCSTVKLQKGERGEECLHKGQIPEPFSNQHIRDLLAVVLGYIQAVLFHTKEAGRKAASLCCRAFAFKHRASEELMRRLRATVRAPQIEQIWSVLRRFV
jgi:hypothetical protein